MKKLFTFFVLAILAFDTLAIGPEVNPFLPQTEGMTIVVTTYTDGSTSTTKVVK